MWQIYMDFPATSEYTSWYVRPTPYTAPSGPMVTPFTGQQAPHELPFMVQPAQQGIHWHPNYGQHLPMPVPPQQPHQQALPFPNCNPETTQLCRTAPLSQQVPPMFHPQTCPQQHFSLLQAPGTSPAQELPVQPAPMPNQQHFVVPKPMETTTLPTSHHELQAPTPEATGAPATSGPTPLQPGDHPSSHPVEVPVKAKPPTPPDHAQQEQQPSGDRPSRNSLRSPLARENKSSRRSRSRRGSTHRRRDPSPKTHRQERERRTTMTRSSHDRHPPRTEKPTTTSRTSRTEPNDGRRRDHPIYRRENTFRQVHQDANSTVYTKETKDKAKSTYVSNFQRSRKDSNITLRSRSKSRKSKRSNTSLAIFERPPGVLLVAKARPERPKGLEDAATRETSVSEATESQQVEIPTTTGLEGVDYRRPSQERDDEETEQDEVIPIPKPVSMDEDWKISVQKAFADPTRTKAPCEIPANEAITLPQTISKREFEVFQEELRARNPKTPLIVIENMASIFAQSGKMNPNQARDSYDFCAKYEVLRSLSTNTFQTSTSL